jgi:hypothetical protein
MASVEEQVESSFNTQLLPPPIQLWFVLGEAIQKQITHDHRILFVCLFVFAAGNKTNKVISTKPYKKSYRNYSIRMTDSFVWMMLDVDKKRSCRRRSHPIRRIKKNRISCHHGHWDCRHNHHHH